MPKKNHPTPSRYLTIAIPYLKIHIRKSIYCYALEFPIADSGIITELKKTQDVKILSDQETVQKLNSRSDLDLSIFSQYDLMSVRQNVLGNIPQNSDIEVATVQDIEVLVELSILCFSEQYPKRNREAAFFSKACSG